MYAVKHRNDAAYIPDREKLHRTIKAVTDRTHVTPVASPARAMHATLDGQFSINPELSQPIEQFRPLLSFAIIIGFCIASWVTIAGFLLPIFW